MKSSSKNRIFKFFSKFVLRKKNKTPEPKRRQSIIEIVRNEDDPVEMVRKLSVATIENCNRRDII